MSAEHRKLVATWGKLVARAWDDPEFKRELVANPAKILAQHGVELPEGRRCEVVEGDAKEDSESLSLPLPPRPSGEELSQGDLSAVVGGVAHMGAGKPSFEWYIARRITDLNRGISWAAVGV